MKRNALAPTISVQKGNNLSGCNKHRRVHPFSADICACCSFSWRPAGNSSYGTRAVFKQRARQHEGNSQRQAKQSAGPKVKNRESAEQVRHTKSCGRARLLASMHGGGQRAWTCAWDMAASSSKPPSQRHGLVSDVVLWQRLSIQKRTQLLMAVL